MTLVVDASPTPRRLPSRYLVAEATASLPVLLTLAATVTLSSGLSGASASWLWVPLVFVVLARVTGPAAQWLTIRYEIGPDGIWVRSGLLARTTRFLTWTSVAAVEVSAPLHLRLWGLTTVAVLQGGDQGARSVLPGVGSAVADEIEARAGTSAASGSTARSVVDASHGRGLPLGTTDLGRGEPVYTASPQDLLLAAVLYGRAAVIGAAGAVGAYDALEAVGLQDAVGRLVDDDPVMLGISVVVLVLAWGLANTLFTYANLTTELSPDAVTIRHGLVSTRSKVVPLRAVIGVELRRNLVEMALGRTRLSLITIDSSGRLGANLVLPSLRDAAVQQVLDGALVAVFDGARRPAQDGPRRLRSALVPVLALAVLPVSAALFVRSAVPGTRLVHVALAFLVSLGATYALGRLLTTRLDVDEDSGTVGASSTFGLDRRVVLRTSVLSGMHVVSWRARQRVITVHYYSSRPRSLVALHPVPGLASRLVRVLQPDDRKAQDRD